MNKLYYFFELKNGEKGSYEFDDLFKVIKFHNDFSKDKLFKRVTVIDNKEREVFAPRIL